MPLRKTLTLALTSLALTATFTTGASTASVPNDESRSIVTAQSSQATQKEQARRWYRDRYLPAMEKSTGWTGSVNGCKAGSFSPSALAAMQQQFNAVRDFARLDRVKLTTSAAQQQAALMMEANNSLSHEPPRSWRCYTKAGAEGAHTSNLALYYGGAGNPLDLYMDDPGSSNSIAGHRRWLLLPQAKTFVVGQTTSANAWKVINTPRNERATNPRFTQWPRAGYSPTQIEPNGRWSLTSNNVNARWSNAKVTVYRNGVRLPAPRVYAPAYGYGNPTLVWDMRSEGKERVGSYKVVVKGLKLPGKPVASVTYMVRLFVA